VTTDYADSGLSIQAAMVDRFKKAQKQGERPDHILWAGLRIVTADSIPVPSAGTVRSEFLSAKGDVEQGFDLKVDGWLTLQGGEKVALLRTWNDPRYAPNVEYPFRSRDGSLRTWNVYKMKYRDGREVEEKWTGNAGMWVEIVSERERIYHCSHGAASPPDFESLVFKITVNG